MVKKTEVPVDDYKRNVWKRSIILCWIFLAISVVIKFIDWDFFNIESDNARFIRVCDWIDKHIVAQKILQFVVYCVGNYLLVFTICGYKNKKGELLWMLFAFASMFCIKFISTAVAVITDFLGVILIAKYFCIPVISFNKKSSLLVCVISVIFQLLCMFIKNISCWILPDYTLIGLIFMIDYYIMLTLLMLYLN